MITTRTQDMCTFLEMQSIIDEGPLYRRIVNKVDPYYVINKLLANKESIASFLPFPTALALLTSICDQLSSDMRSNGQLTHVNVKKTHVNGKKNAKIFVFGDIHGQFDDLLKWFKNTGTPSAQNKDQFLFLGDYVDRGEEDVEVIFLLLLLKYTNPLKIHLLRGNHECFLQNSHYGFKMSCKRHYGTQKGLQIWKAFNEVFNFLPRSALINDTIFCVHGGISPKFFHKDFKSLSQLQSFKEDNGTKKGIMTDLFWSDPNDDETEGKLFVNNGRGISYEFNKKAVDEFHKKFNTSLILRAHQMVDGIEYKFGKKLITIFSAPQYGGNKNRGAVLVLQNPTTSKVDKGKLNMREMYL